MDHRYSPVDGRRWLDFVCVDGMSIGCLMIICVSIMCRRVDVLVIRLPVWAIFLVGGPV